MRWGAKGHLIELDFLDYIARFTDFYLHLLMLFILILVTIADSLTAHYRSMHDNLLLRISGNKLLKLTRTFTTQGLRMHFESNRF